MYDPNRSSNSVKLVSSVRIEPIKWMVTDITLHKQRNYLIVYFNHNREFYLSSCYHLKRDAEEFKHFMNVFPHDISFASLSTEVQGILEYLKIKI